MIHTSNTLSAKPVARLSKHADSRLLGMPKGFIVEIALRDPEGIQDMRWISSHRGGMTNYTPVKREALPMPKDEAVQCADFLKLCDNVIFPGFEVKPTLKNGRAA